MPQEVQNTIRLERGVLAQLPLLAHTQFGSSAHSSAAAATTIQVPMQSRPYRSSADIAGVNLLESGGGWGFSGVLTLLSSAILA